MYFLQNISLKVLSPQYKLKSLSTSLCTGVGVVGRSREREKEKQRSVSFSLLQNHSRVVALKNFCILFFLRV
jgi:hypothetical protein